MRGGERSVEGETNATETDVGDFDLPAVLAKLDAEDRTTRLEGVETVHRAVAEDPGRAIPTVPKLRSVLEDGSCQCQRLAAASLAELAAESAVDVAPSADTIAVFVGSQTDTDRPTVTADALRCLTYVARERPDAVVDHVDDIAPGPGAGEQSTKWGREALTAVSAAYPDRVDAAVSKRAWGSETDHR